MIKEILRYNDYQGCERLMDSDHEQQEEDYLLYYCPITSLLRKGQAKRLKSMEGGNHEESEEDGTNWSDIEKRKVNEGI